ncbi:MAG: bifunctional phosphoribosylaminoimidazolecarboxamide formyltransferase/IMP cyclohydrolase [Candidatus Dormibacteria bacterium]
MLTPRRALLGVDDKRGLLEFATGLSQHGVELVATGGTAGVLLEGGLQVTPISELTNVGELLEGRVKTLHPAVHAGILARRDRPEDMETLARHGYSPIDMVVVNLYPFAAVAASGATLEQVVEAIDIGGPTLLRAAAKNWRDVAAVSDPAQYPEVLAAINADGISPEQLREMALRVFQLTAAYDAGIAAHLDRTPPRPDAVAWPDRLILTGRLLQPLRYGENPHQRGAIYTRGDGARGIAAARQLQGAELSYTNWLDADSAWRLSQVLPAPAAVVIKHTNPCGVALGNSSAEAFERAYECDPRSAYGGIVGLNQPLDAAAAGAIRGHFLELVVAPGVTPEAASILATKGRLRVLAVDSPTAAEELELRSVDGGFLVQSPDLGDDPRDQFTVVSKRPPTADEWVQLRLAWQVVRAVKSNAIVLCREGMAVGIGAGQMSRVEAVHLAVARAGGRAGGSCLASDAFFPMPDGLQLAADAGVTAAIHPGGSVRDLEVLAAADQAGMALVATGRRHFRH